MRGDYRDIQILGKVRLKTKVHNTSTWAFYQTTYFQTRVRQI